MQSAIFPTANIQNSVATGWNTSDTGRPTAALSHSRLQGLSDTDLLARCASGDAMAFDTLVARYYNYIYSTAYRLSGNHDDAADLVSETSVRMFRHIGTFQHAVTLPAWIKRIVTNAFLDTRRRETRRPATSLDALVEQNGDALMAADEEVENSPYRSAELNERKRVLAAAIKSLPQSQQEMVLMFHASSRSYEEIAADMQVPVGTVKSRLNRARAALREKLMPQMSMLVS